MLVIPLQIKSIPNTSCHAAKMNESFTQGSWWAGWGMYLPMRGWGSPFAQRHHAVGSTEVLFLGSYFLRELAGSSTVAYNVLDGKALGQRVITVIPVSSF